MKTVSLKLPLATSPARRSQPCYADRTTVTMLREKTAMPPATIPECVLVDFHECEGTVPPGRWGHSAAVINDRLYVFGGEGDQAFGDLNVYAPGDSAGPSHSRGRVKFTINLLAWFQQNFTWFCRKQTVAYSESVYIRGSFAHVWTCCMQHRQPNVYIWRQAGPKGFARPLQAVYWCVLIARCS